MKKAIPTSTRRKAAAVPARTPAPAAAPAPAATNHLVIRDPAQVGMVSEYCKLQALAKETKDRLEVLNDAIKRLLGDAPVAYAGTHVLSINVVPAIPATPNRLVSQDMVGTVLVGTKGRAGYTQLSVR